MINSLQAVASDPSEPPFRVITSHFSGVVWSERAVALTVAAARRRAVSKAIGTR